MYENHIEYEFNPFIKHVISVWIKSSIPIDKGCFINKNKVDDKIDENTIIIFIQQIV